MEVAINFFSKSFIDILNGLPKILGARDLFFHPDAHPFSLIHLRKQNPYLIKATAAVANSTDSTYHEIIALPNLKIYISTKRSEALNLNNMKLYNAYS